MTAARAGCDGRRRAALARAAAHFELRGRTAECAGLVDVVGKDVLDVGCSFGWYARHALERGARSVVGVDVDEGALALAEVAAPAARFVRGSALELPFDEARFDVVAAFDVLEHVPKRTEPIALHELRRVLRADGLLALSTPNHRWLTTFTDPAYYVGHRHYRPAAVAALLTGAGFDVEHIHLRGRFFEQLDLLLYYFWRHVFRREVHPFPAVRRRADREWASDAGWNTIFVVARPAAHGGRL